MQTNTTIIDAMNAYFDAQRGKHHIAIYNGKAVSMDYISNPKEQFKYACMRIRDNNAEGIVICPDGKKYAITKDSKKAKLIQ